MGHEKLSIDYEHVLLLAIQGVSAQQIICEYSSTRALEHSHSTVTSTCTLQRWDAGLPLVGAKQSSIDLHQSAL